MGRARKALRRAGNVPATAAPGSADRAVNAATAFELLRAVDLPAGDYAVFGSGPLLVRGIIEEATDIDIIARKAAWSQALEQGELTYLPDEGITVAAFFDGALTVGTTWAFGDVDIDDLIDTAELFDGVPFVRIEHVIAFKRVADRVKDHDHLQRIERWMQTLPSTR